MNSVHGSWTTVPVSSLWTKDMAIAGSLLELLLLADSGQGARREIGKRKRALWGFSFAYYRGLGGSEDAAHQQQCFSLKR
jgi:hypothetical protein